MENSADATGFRTRHVGHPRHFPGKLVKRNVDACRGHALLRYPLVTENRPNDRVAPRADRQLLVFGQSGTSLAKKKTRRHALFCTSPGHLG
jgi:hypothetical protein